MTHFLFSVILCFCILSSLGSSCSHLSKRLIKFYLSYQCCLQVTALCVLFIGTQSHSPTVVSHNVRGLNIPEKWLALLRELKKGRLHFAFLQETHFKTHNTPRLTDSYFTEAYHATNDLAKSKGVTILISKEANFELTDKLMDP